MATLATLTLVLPTFTTSTPGPSSRGSQLAFAAVASLALYALFVLRPDRPPPRLLPARGATPRPTRDVHAEPPSDRQALESLGLLVVALVAVVGLAKIESPAIEDAVAAIGAPQSAVGVVIALLVLLPETLAAVRNARRGRVQISLNLALRLGDGEHRPDDPDPRRRLDLARPAARARARRDRDRPPGDHRRRRRVTVPLGRATLQQAGVRLVLFAAFLFLAVVP